VAHNLTCTTGLFFFSAVVSASIAASNSPQATYCNPVNIDYGFASIPGAIENGKHRATADPAIVVYRGDYYLFSTNQAGYWWSSDMSRWNFVPRRFLKPENETLNTGERIYDDLCAPAPFVMNDALYVIGSTYTQDFPIWKSTNPKTGEWTQATPAFPVGAWDPAFFLDDDGRLYLYYGSSNDKPIYGQEIDRHTLEPIGRRHELIQLHDDLHGWERFGEANDNTWLRPFIEGAWMTKHAGKYYLQYGGPGTEFSGYADGVYVGDQPLGPFTYQAHNPFSYKPGGFARGAGHGSTFQDPFGNWWHTSTIAIGVKNNFERRIGIWPAGFDQDGVLYCNQAYGDYPHYLPCAAGDSHPSGSFTGWMLLNYAKPVTASSTLGGFAPNLAVDEDIRTYWSAATGDPGEWFATDLGAVSTIRAIQINYADQDATVAGKQAGLYHQYILEVSNDGREWAPIADKSDNRTDVPHDYVELPEPVEARFVRIENRHMPTGKFALSGLRIFGCGHGPVPEPVAGFVALRGESERRNAWLKWRGAADATGYLIHCGIDPDKLYTSLMVYGESECYFRAMDKDHPYYFQIEAFNEDGVSPRSETVKTD
jgi:xylan 1,4-beta-xylosidase